MPSFRLIVVIQNGNATGSWRKRRDSNLGRELQIWVAEKLTRHKSPRWIEVIEARPETATGELSLQIARKLTSVGHAVNFIANKYRNYSGG